MSSTQMQEDHTHIPLGSILKTLEAQAVSCKVATARVTPFLRNVYTGRKLTGDCQRLVRVKQRDLLTGVGFLYGGRKMFWNVLVLVSLQRECI